MDNFPLPGGMGRAGRGGGDDKNLEESFSESRKRYTPKLLLMCVRGGGYFGNCYLWDGGNDLPRGM